MRKIRLSTKLLIAFGVVIVGLLGRHGLHSAAVVKRVDALKSRKTVAELHELLQGDGFEQIDLKPFTHVRLNASYPVMLAKGEKFELVYGKDFYQNVQFSQQGDTLILEWGGWAAVRGNAVPLYIFMPEDPRQVSLDDYPDAQIYGFGALSLKVPTSDSYYHVSTDVPNLNVEMGDTRLRLEMACLDESQPVEYVNLKVLSEKGALRFEGRNAKALDADLQLEEAGFSLYVNEQTHIGKLNIEGSVKGTAEETISDTYVSRIDFPGACDSLTVSLTCPEGLKHELRIPHQLAAGYSRVSLSDNIKQVASE